MNGLVSDTRRECLVCPFHNVGTFWRRRPQDSTVQIWKARTNAWLSTLKGHSQEYECLRTTWASATWAKEELERQTPNSTFSTLVATAGADGVVKVWASKDPFHRDSFKCVHTMSHAELRRQTHSDEDGKQEEEEYVPQIYALQFIDHWRGVGDRKEHEKQFLDDIVR